MSDQAAAITVIPRSVVERTARRSFVGHAKIIGLLTLGSRILGLAREVVMGHYLGTGLVASAFTVAFTVPNLFRKLFGEGALSAAFIPLYTQAVRAENASPPTAEPGSANLFAAASVNLLLMLLVGVTLVGELILAYLILASGPIRPDRLLTLKFAALMLPYVTLICGTAFLGAILQVHHRFGPPAAAPMILNIVHVAVVLLGARFLKLHLVDATDDLPQQTTLAYWLGFAVLGAGVLQIVMLVPSLRAVGFRFEPLLAFWTPPIRRMLRLSVPVALGAGVLQFSVLMDKGLSLLLTQYSGDAGTITHFSIFGHTLRYPMEMGAPARLNLAQFLYQFPLGVFAIALATAIFPGLSASAFDKDREQFRATLRQGVEATLFEGLPASLGLIMVREPAIRLVFQHGWITAHDAELISRSVLFYSMAIWAFSLQQIVNRAYYALHDTATPLVASIVTLVVNLVVEIPLLWTPLGEAGMAAGTAVSFIIQAMLMLWLLDRRLGGLGLDRIAWPAAKMVMATAIMGGVLMILQRLPLYPHGGSRKVWLSQFVLLAGVGAGTYFLVCELLGVEAMRHFTRPTWRKRRRA